LTNRQDSEVLFKKEIKYAGAIGDWTLYRPAKPPLRRPTYLLQKLGKISYDELSSLLDMHSKFSFLMLDSLQNSLKLSAELFSSSSEQLLYGDFIRRMDVPLLYAKLILQDLGEVMLLVDFSLINSIINFSLGCPNKVISPRNLTEVEESIITTIMEKIGSNFTSCWQNSFKKPEFRVISCPTLLREPAINTNELITQFTSIVSLGGAPPSRIIIAYQNSLLRSLLDLLNKKIEERPIDFERIPQAILESAYLPVSVTLGETSLRANELVNLEADDIIQLDTKLSSLVTVNVGDLAELLGQPGIKENKYSVRIVEQKARALAASEKPSAIENPMEEAVQPAEGSSSEEELPMEEEGKEEYNTAQEEDIFGEESSPGGGGTLK